jgi:hypothetical protein
MTSNDGMKCTMRPPSGALNGFEEDNKLENGRKP